MIDYIKDISFENPYWFLIFIAVIFFAIHYYFTHSRQKAYISLSSLDWVNIGDIKSWRQRLIHLPIILRLIALSVLIIVMARPQVSNSRQQVDVEGIDIIMALDVSGSMMAMDFKPDRLEASQKIAKKFIDNRTNDRIGLVVFGSEAFTQCPLTIDHQVLKNLFDPIKYGIVEDGTAIGDGLATAINRLKDSEAVSKVVILLTDGVQNSGNFDPGTAATLAKTYGIRVYTIGIGKIGMAPTPVQDFDGRWVIVDMPVRIDEDVLKSVSKETDGKYFRATSNTNLEEIYNEIDKLEKSKIEVNVFKNRYDKFFLPLIIAITFLLMELLLRLTILKSKP